MNPKYKAVSEWIKKIDPKRVSHPPKRISGTKLTVLGCGTSSGCPVLACKCKTCKSSNPKNKRTRASIVIQVGSRVFLIDASPDLRSQALRENLFWVDAVLFTHAHADHSHGMDDLRSFNYLMRSAIPCFGNELTIKEIRQKFEYIFISTQEGGGKPVINLHTINKPIKIHGVKTTPLPLIHGGIEVLGFRIKDVAYITDCSYIPDQTLKLLRKLEVLVLDCLRPSKHPTHLNVNQALDWAKKIGARKTYFTHMGHELEYNAFAKTLPKGMYPAFDGLVIHTK